MTKLPALAIMAIWTASAQPIPQQDVTLHIHSGNVSGILLARTKQQASMVLSQVGVHVQWKGYDVNLPARQCTGSLVDVSDIDILILDESRPHDHPGALAYALPFAKSGFRIVVFHDRVLHSAGRPNPELFGHVIAHEVGHMLLGVLSHSGDGLMQAHWASQDISAMQMHPLQFSLDDILTIAQRSGQRRRACSPPELLASAPPFNRK